MGVKYDPTKRVQVVEVVVTSLTVLGDGVSDPLRRIVQVWSTEGDLIAEYDPVKEDESV